MTSPDGIQALYVFTDPVCLSLLEFVHEGLTSEAEIAALTAERLGIATSRAAETLDGLVGIGYVSRTGKGRVADRGAADFADRCAAFLDQVDWLHDEGDHEQAEDILDAFSASRSAGSWLSARRWAAGAFQVSEAGLRHAARVAAGDLGQPSLESALASESAPEPEPAR
ncbi:hypothetical protein [Frondihabitans cladoniiphilus]|uniref:Uncharacterized protein n=1 Tax=Frondihabitans cladoniiphilus TaxID=715785 RepID=A0ABP8VSY9_9MICO